MTTLSDLLAALHAIEAKGTELHAKAERTAISNEDWRYSNGYAAAVRAITAALAAFDPSRFLDLDDPATVERLADALDWVGTAKQDDDDWTKTRPKRPSELAADAVAALREGVPK